MATAKISPPAPELSGQTAIISGALGDIGTAIALELAKRGADIALGDILPAERSQPLREKICHLGRRARYDRVDVSNAKTVTRWLAAVEKSLGRPTLIIPNAAIVTLANLRQLTPQQWRHELSINLDGAFHLAHAAALRLIAPPRRPRRSRRPARIIFIGSWAGHAPHAHIPTYCVAKAAMRMLCQLMAKEFAADDILVNEVAPGYVDAGLTGQLFAKDPPLRRRSIQRVPIHRLISPHEVALEVAHLCDPANRHMTGSVLLMDGGLSLR